MTLPEFLGIAASALLSTGAAIIMIGRHLRKLRDDLAALSNQVSAEGTNVAEHADQLHTKLDAAIERLPKSRAKRGKAAS